MNGSGASDLLTQRFAAVAERLLPAAAGLPGAAEAQVSGYFVRLDQQPQFATIESDLRQGLELMNTLAMEIYGVDLTSTSSEQRDVVLRRFESLPLPSTQHCFRLLVFLTISGYLCHPIHGGNRDAIAWRALGLQLENRRANALEVIDAT